MLHDEEYGRKYILTIVGFYNMSMQPSAKDNFLNGMYCVKNNHNLSKNIITYTWVLNKTSMSHE